MPYAANGNVRIHYHSVGSGPPLVLLHGLSGSLHDWEDTGYIEVLSASYRLVLIDARGHGASDKPHDPAAYAPRAQVLDVTSVLDDLEISQAHVLGYSMGGWVAYNLAIHAPGRVTTLMVGGEDPYELTFENMRQVLRKGMDAWVGVWEAWSGPMPAARRERVLASDADALLACAQDRADLSQALSAVDIPCLLFVGENDPGRQRVYDCAQRLQEVRLVCLPGLTHHEAESRSDLVLPHIVEFLREAVPA